MTIKNEVIQVRNALINDLKRHPKGRYYPRVPQRLREFIALYVPVAEIVTDGSGERIRLKS